MTDTGAGVSIARRRDWLKFREHDLHEFDIADNPYRLNIGVCDLRRFEH